MRPPLSQSVPSQSNRTSFIVCLLSIVIPRAVLHVETEQVPGLHHMRRQRCGNLQAATIRMRNVDMPGMQMQALLDAARKIPVRILDEIFRIADDRMADMQRMDAKLVGTASIRLHFQPREAL